MRREIFKQAGAIACLLFCAACAQVAMISVTPTLAAFARHLDRATSERIVELEQKRDWSGMLALAQAQLQREPGQENWWALQGYALDRLGRQEAAVESYQKALRLSPEDEDAWLALGQTQIALGHSDQAIAAFRQALRYRPESAQAYLALADLYQQLRQPDLALPNYREAVRYEPELEPAWIGLASAYHATGQIDRRDQALQGVRKLDPAAADRLEKQFSGK